MEQNAVNSVPHYLFIGPEEPLNIRLRILLYLWDRSSIDNYTFNDTKDILFGIHVMLKNKLYIKETIEQIEEKTLYYFFPEKSSIDVCKSHQKRYLLLKKLISFVGGYASISFVAKYGYIEQSNNINLEENKELTNLEYAVLNFCDFLTNISIKDIKKYKFSGKI